MNESEVISKAKLKIEKSLAEALENLSVDFDTCPPSEMEMNSSKNFEDASSEWLESEANDEGALEKTYEIPLTKSEVTKVIQEAEVALVGKNEEIDELMSGDRKEEFEEMIELLRAEQLVDESEEVAKKNGTIKGKVYDFDPKQHGVRSV